MVGKGALKVNVRYLHKIESFRRLAIQRTQCFDAVNDALDTMLLCVCSSKLRIICLFSDTK